jgi:hypothetical protein
MSVTMHAVKLAAGVVLDELDKVLGGVLIDLLLSVHAEATAVASTLSAATALSDPLTVPPSWEAANRRCHAPALRNPGRPGPGRLGL